MAKKGNIKNIDVKQLEDDSEIYSSKHYIYGELIVKCWRDFVRAKAADIEAFEEKERAERAASEGESGRRLPNDSELNQSPQK